MPDSAWGAALPVSLLPVRQIREVSSIAAEARAWRLGTHEGSPDDTTTLATHAPSRVRSAGFASPGVVCRVRGSYERERRQVGHSRVGSRGYRRIKSLGRGGLLRRP